MSFRESIKKYAESPLSRQMVMDVLSNYKRPNDKISELIKDESLISVRRGLYVTGPKLDLPCPEPFLIANHLRGPSYVSLDSAMSYWGLIPERTYEVSSVTIKSSKKYSTKIGRYSYKQLSLPYYAFGIKNIIQSEKQTMLIATPEKALCDKIVLTPGINLRSIKQTAALLLEDLRVDEDVLQSFDLNRMSEWMEEAPKRKSLKMLIRTISSL